MGKVNVFITFKSNDLSKSVSPKPTKVFTVKLVSSAYVLNFSDVSKTFNVLSCVFKLVLCKFEVKLNKLLALYVLVFSRLMGVVVIVVKLDFNWFVKKYFFVVHKLEVSNQLKPWKPEDVSFSVVRELKGVEELLNPKKFWNKESFWISSVCVSCVIFEEFQILRDVLADSTKFIPMSFLVWVKAFKSIVLELLNNEFFKSHLSCFAWVKLLYI
jgi:hypothetical protein